MKPNKTIILVLIILAAVAAGIIYFRQKSGYIVQSSGISGQVMLGPQCPVIREGEDCPDKPYQTSLAVTTPDGARVIKELKTETDGRFNVQLPPGEYAIRSAAAANILPYCSSAQTILVSQDNYTVVTISCDTGIR